MSYPEPRCAGTDGEVSAWRRPADAAPDLDLGGTRAHHLATGAQTDGLFGLYRWEMGPHPGGAAPHVHRTIAESFYVLTGLVQVFDGERWLDAVPGDFVHVPPGGIHGFRNESGDPASMLIHFAPGAPREGYFEGLPRLREMTEEERREFFVRHDTYWV